MATSGSVDYTRTRNQIIELALQCIGVTDVTNPNIIMQASDMLNILLKAIQNKHVFLPTIDRTQKTFVASSEVTGTDGKIYTCMLSHTSSANDRPITGANFTTFWVEKGSTGGGWITATSYSSIGDFSPGNDCIGIEKAFIRDGGNDYPLTIIDKNKYSNILDKSNTGRPYLLYFEQKLTPQIYLYYQPDRTDYVLHYWKVTKLEDFDAAGNNPDMTQRWIDYLIFALAYKLSFLYGTPVDQKEYIRLESQRLFAEAKANDVEYEDRTFIKPAFSRRRYY